nr:FecR domain-containing protein [Pyxidicoccus caerfyrddinensis]
MSTARPYFLSLMLLVAGCDEDAATPSATPVAPAPVPDAGPGAELGRLEGLSGEVRLERGGKLLPAVAGPLHGGDAVETGAGGAATVRFPDGRSVEVGPDARFAMGEDSGGIVMQVERGIILSRVPAGARPSSPGAKKVTLSILTPFGLTRVGSDAPSEVSVAVEKDAGRVEVRLGAIEFVGKDGQELRAAQGEAVAVAGGKVELVRTPRVVELAPIPVTVRLGAGRAEVRPQGTVRWRPVKKQGEVLSPGDGVRTRPGGTAVLALEGSSSVLSLGSGTELVLESAGQGGTTDEARVDLRQGGLGLQLAQGRTSRVVLPGLGLEGSGAGLEVRRTATGYRVDAFTGQVTLVRGESRQPLRAGERATLEGTSGAARVEPLAPAPLALSMGDGAEVYHQGLSEVAFTWEGEGAAQVEVATDAGFTRPVLTGTVYRPFVNVSAPARGTLYWRVRREDGTEMAKGSASFAPERPSKDLDRVRNVVPEGPEKTTIFYQDKPPAVTFTYGAEASAAKYRVAVYRVGALGTPVAERIVPDTRAALDAGALVEGSYLWSVTPLSASGAQLKGGRMNKLELVYDNSVPELVVASPRNGTRAAEKVRATGVAPVDARLSINGRPIPLDGKHRFSTWVEPVGTPPMLVFKMNRPGAPEVHTVRTLKPRGP